MLQKGLITADLWYKSYTTSTFMRFCQCARPKIKLLQHPLLILGAIITWMTAGSAFCQEFQLTIGGADREFAFDVQRTRNGRYILTGSSESNNFIPNKDLLVIKMDEHGDTLWSRVFGGDQLETGNFVLPLEDLGAVIVGDTRSFGAGSFEGFFLRLDEEGGIISSRTYGGSYIDHLFSALLDHDGGFILLGTLGSSVNTERELLLIKTDQVGNVVWSKTYGGPLTAHVGCMIRLADNALLIGGSAGVTSGALLMKVTPSGEILWSKEYVHGQLSTMRGMVERADGSVLITGMTRSSGPHTLSDDMFIMKIDPVGGVQWARRYGGLGTDSGTRLMELEGGDLVVIGSTWSFGNGQGDLHFMRTDSVGELVWSKAFGGALREHGVAMDTTSHGGFLLWGMTESYGAGNYDVYMIRTDSSGHSGCNEMDIPTQATAITFSHSDLAVTASNVDLIVMQPDVQSAHGNTMQFPCIPDEVGFIELPGMKFFHMYPNPVTRVLSIEVPENSGKYQIHIHNSSGQLVFNAEYGQQMSSLDLKGHPHGLYMVTVTAGSWRGTQRLIVIDAD